MGGGPPDPEISGGESGLQNIFLALRVSVWSKNKGDPGPSLVSATEWQLPGIAFSKVSLLLGIQTVQCDDY